MKIVNNMPQVLICLFVIVMVVHPEDKGLSLKHFELGNQAYENGDYDSAIACYQKIVAGGTQNPDTYYNLGNACFRLNKLGYAILFYEKARKLDPQDEDIAANLKFAEASIIDKVPTPETSFLAKTLKGLQGVLSLKATSLLASLLLAMLCIDIILGMFSGYNGRLIAIYAGVILFLCFVLLSVSLGIKIHNYENAKHAIVVADASDALNEPEGAQKLFSVHEGTKFRIRKRLEDWVLVSLPNGMAGWVEEKHLREI